jgi:hypothetical protein
VICSSIKVLAQKADHADRKAKEYKTAIGQFIHELKRLHQDNWEQIVETECGVGRRRAYELMQIADGSLTEAELRARNAASKRKSRALKSAGRPAQSPAPASAIITFDINSVESIRSALAKIPHDSFFAALPPDLRAEIDRRLGDVIKRRIATPEPKLQFVPKPADDQPAKHNSARAKGSAALQLLRERPELSDKEIAEQTRVDARTVTGLRKSANAEAIRQAEQQAARAGIPTMSSWPVPPGETNWG